MKKTDAPLTKAAAPVADVIALEKEVLGLPSDLSAEDRNKYDLKLLVECELRIRISQALYQLEVVRKTVKPFACLPRREEG